MIEIYMVYNSMHFHSYNNNKKHIIIHYLNWLFIDYYYCCGGII